MFDECFWGVNAMKHYTPPPFSVDAALMQQWAVKHKLTLCDYCMQPIEVHTGFDNRSRQCNLATSNWGLSWKYHGNQKKIASILDRVDKFWRDVQAHIDGERCAGSEI